MQLTVLYAAYNEAENIGETVSRSLASLRTRFEEFEILIVDDGSVDATLALAEALAEAHPEVRVLANPRNMGQGRSLDRGFGEARGEWVLHNAMDYPFDLEDLDAFLPLMGEADVIVAARSERAGYSAYRKLLSVVNVFLINGLFRLGLSDYNFVQMYRKVVLEAVDVQAKSTGFLTPETIVRARDLGYRVSEVRVPYHPRRRGMATAGRLGVVLESMRDMLRFWWRRRTARRVGAEFKRTGTS